MAFNVYKSSAGSGKTFTLVKEFLKLCLGSESTYFFTGILAITFTNKATAEMKERLLKQLKLLAKGEQDTMSELIATELKLEPKQLQKRAAATLTAILHQYGDLSISTIDHFTHRLVRTFARDLGVSMNFKLLLKHEELMSRAVAELIGKVGVEEQLTKLLQNFVMQQIENEKAWDIEGTLFDFASNLLNEQSFFYLQQVEGLSPKAYAEDRDLLKKRLKSFRAETIKTGKELLSITKRHQVEPKHLLNGVYNYFINLNDFREDKLEPGANTLKGVEQDYWHAKKLKGPEADQVMAAAQELTPVLKNYLEFQERELPDYHAAKAVYANLFNLEILQHIDKEFQALKKLDQALHISDLNKKIAQVVLKEAAPFIYERIGSRYQNIMIDEFQDTSILQFLNLLPLIDESLAAGNFNLIVGDAKQAIYRFRGGVSEQFANMPEIQHLYQDQDPLVQERLLSLKAQYQEKQLAINRRSSKEVVEFNNRFFEFVCQDQMIEAQAKKAFETVRQELPPKTEEGGYVSLDFLPYGSEKEEQLEMLLEHIESALADDFSLDEIAVLCRKKDQANLVAEYLKRNDLPVLSSEALLIKNSPKVQFLVSLLQWVVKPEDPAARLSIVRFLSRDLADEEREELLFTYTKPTSRLEDLFVKLISLSVDRSCLSKFNLFAFFEQQIRDFNLVAQHDVYLQFFQENVLAYAKDYGNHYPSFLNWWEQQKDSLSLEITAEIEAVKVLTIHKSKGLEFGVTIIPFLNQKASVHRLSQMWVSVPKELGLKLPYTLVRESKDLAKTVFASQFQEEMCRKQEDLLNDNYVGFTRAVDRLHLLVGPLPKKPADYLSIDKLLYDFAAPANNETKVEFGSLSRKVKEERTVARESEILSVPYTSNPWQDKVRLSSELSAFYDEEEKAEAIAYGNLIHEILAELNQVDDIERVLERFLLQGRINQSQKETYIEKLSKILQMKALRPFFDPAKKVYQEAVIINANGKRLRPDRMVEDEKQIMILEYKTGAYNEAHFKQLDEYRNVIQAARGKAVSGAVLYVAEEKLIELN